MAPVRELIEKLSVLDPDKRVVLEGCDCYGDWDGTIGEHNDIDRGSYVLLDRLP